MADLVLVRRMLPQLATKAKIAALTFVVSASSYGTGSGWDLGHFKNETSADVLVYLTDRPDHYYAVFGVDRGGANVIDLRPDTTAIVTLVPPGKARQTVLTPEGKQIAKSKLFVPARQKRDARDRHIVYVIRDGKVTFVASPSSNKTMQPTASPRTASLSDE